MTGVKVEAFAERASYPADDRGSCSAERLPTGGVSAHYPDRRWSLDRNQLPRRVIGRFFSCSPLAPASSRVVTATWINPQGAQNAA